MDPSVPVDQGGMDALKEEKEDVPAASHGHAATTNGVMKPNSAVDMAPVLARLRDILPHIDLATTSEKMLRKRLEDELSIDLSKEKAAIRAEIQAYLEANSPAEEEEEEEAAVPAKKKKGGGGGLNKEKLLSPALAAVIGSERASRPQVVKLLWVYIKENNLQNPKDKRKIILDDKLKAIFPRPINAFSMNTYLSAHIMDENECVGGEGGEQIKTKSSKAKVSKKKKMNEDEDEEEDDDDDADYEGMKKRKRKSSATGDGAKNKNNFTKPLALSPKLAALIGTSQMSRPEITSFLNSYCKEHNLHDPSNKQRIICDDVLRDLFDVDSFRAFGEPMRLIKPHVSHII